MADLGCTPLLASLGRFAPKLRYLPRKGGGGVPNICRRET
jgi:hypothetical protein